MKLIIGQYSGLFKIPAVGVLGLAIAAAGIAIAPLKAQTCTPPPGGMLSWWRGESNAVDSVGTNNGALLGGATYVPGLVGEGFSIPGTSGSGIQLGATPSLQLQNFTIEAWIRLARVGEPTLTGGTGDGLIFGNGSGGYGMGIHPDGELFLTQIDVNSVYSGASILDTNYHHVAVTKSGTSVVLYIDGVAYPVGTAYTSTFTFTQSAIGARGDTMQGDFYGTIDEVSVYSSILTASQIQAIYQSGAAGKCTANSGLPSVTVTPVSQTNYVGSSPTFEAFVPDIGPNTLQWTLDGTNIAGATNATLVLAGVQSAQAGSYAIIVSNSAGSVTSSPPALLTLDPSECSAPPAGIVSWWRGEGNAYDWVGTNNGVLEGGVTYATGEVGDAFVIPGTTGSGILLGSAPSLQLQNFTIEGWIKLTEPGTPTLSTSAGNNGVILCWGAGGYGFGVEPNGDLLLTEVGVNGIDSTAAITDTNYHHVAVTKSGTAVVFYLDGVAYPYPTGYSASFTFNQLGLGTRGDDSLGTLYGSIDEISVYSNVLSATQIQAIYESKYGGKCTGTGAPIIVFQPTNETAVVGFTAAIQVSAVGTSPLLYQWAFDGTNISGATNQELILNDVQTNQAGSYTVVVSNSFASTTSSVPTILSVVPVTCTSPNPSLVGWWRAEGLADDLVGTNVGTLEGGVTYGPGEVGQAFKIDGTNGSGIYLGAAPSLQIQNFTIEAWIKMAQAGTVSFNSLGGTAGAIFAYGYGGYGFAVQPGGQLVLTQIGVNGIASSAAITDTNWHHVAVTKSGTAVVFYLDGVAYPFGSAYSVNFTFNDAAIGARGDDMYANLYGSLDEVSVYNGALSPAQILSIYQSGSSGKCENLAFLSQPTNQTVIVGQTAMFESSVVAASPRAFQWTFNGTNLASATNAALVLPDAQLSQSGSYAVVVSNVSGSVTSSPPAILTVALPTCTAPPSGIVGWWRGEGAPDDWVGTNSGILHGGVTYAAGEVGQGFSFTGSNGCGVELGTASALRLQSFTVEAWVQLAQPGTPSRGTNGTDGEIFAWGAGGFGFGIHPNGALFLTDIGSTMVSSSATITDTNFHHVAVTKSGASVNFYLDGVVYPYGTVFFPSFTFSQAGIGARGDNLLGNFYGAIDELAVYNQALSPSQIASIYNSSYAGKCPGSVAPFVFAPVSTVNAYVGTNLTLTTGADGSQPLVYQWTMDGTNLSNATNATLVLTNLQLAQAGTYAIVVSNALSAVTNTNTFLSVTYPPTEIEIISNSVAGGGTVVVSVDMLANGNEGGVQFSVDFPYTNLVYVSSAVGSGASGAAFLVNTTNVAAGQLGMFIGLPGGTFAPGLQQIATVTFQAILPTNTISVPISFGGSPISEALSDSGGNGLPVAFQTGAIQIVASEFEGDISPRTNGNEVVNISDWIQEGLFVAGLQVTSNADEFARADCAPRSSGGDGVIDLFDWVQVGRYAAGLDSATAVGYPPGSGSPNLPGALVKYGAPTHNGGAAHTVSIVPVTQNALTNVVAVTCTTTGNENSLGFSVSFDPTTLRFVSASLGSGAPGATLVVNSTNAANGQLGFLVGYFPPGVFAAGTPQLVTLSFATVYYSNKANLAFANTPITCALADTNAAALSASFQNGSLVVGGSQWPTLGIAASGTNVVLSWPVSPNPMLAQSLASFGLNWSNSPGTEITNGTNVSITLPAPTNFEFYRLISP